MKAKKILLAVFSFMFVLALGVGLTADVKEAKAATETEVSIAYACVEYSAQDGTGVPTTYTFVAGLTTPEIYDTYVYFDGKKVPAQVHDGNFYVNHGEFDCAVGQTFLLEIPAGTYYQSDAVVKSTVLIKCTLSNSYADSTSSAYNKQGVLNREALTVISDSAYGIELYKVDWAINACDASNLYVRIPDGEGKITSGTDSDWSAHAQYSPICGALTLNGNAISSNVQKVYAQAGDHKEAAYISVSGVSKAGDVLTFDGWFYNATYGAFKIENTSFIYDGKSWDEANAGTYSFDVSTTSDANPQNGFYLSMSANHIPVGSEDNGWQYATRPAGTNFYGYHNSANVEIKFRKFSATDWYVALNETGITAVAGDVITFGGWYVCTDASAAQHFIKLNTQSYSFDGSKWTEITPSITVNVNGSAIGETLVVNPGQSASDVTAISSNGNAVDINFIGAVSDGKFELRKGESFSEYLATFSTTDGNGAIYRKQVVVHVGFTDFVMEDGAAVRVTATETNGLRFSAEMSADTYVSLKSQGATFGMVIVPRDYVTDGYELTASNLFGANAKYSTTATAGSNQAVRRMLLLDNLTPVDFDGDGKYEIRGAITEIITSNLTREFVGVAYTCVNGEYIIASYYGDDIENNARSIYYVSQKAIDANDNAQAVQSKYIDGFNEYLAGRIYSVEYTVRHVKTKKGTVEVDESTLTAALNTEVEISANAYDGYALTSPFSEIALKLYANKKNLIEFYYKDLSLPDLDATAWHHPKLDATNDYMNDTNKAIAETMRDAGFTSVMLNGSSLVGDLYLNSPANIEIMKSIINMFWTYGGITTYVSGKNAGVTNEYVSLENYQSLQAEMATLTECEGFGGFFAWDEPLPLATSMERLAEYAEWFDGLYGDDALFMVNLFPSYYDGWSSGDYTSYSAYIKAYCDTVLSQVTNGTKYLSMDSYPVYADGTLSQTFMYDMAVLKHYALEYGAQANAILQACGWNSTNNNRVPNEEEYRFMYYTALAFGMDSVGWWGYSPESENADVILGDQTPVDIYNNKSEAYNAIKSVVTEVANFGSLYKTYDWQGVVMSSPSKGFIGIGKDAQYDAFNNVKSDSLLSGYILSASSTSSFSSISGSGSNYVVGVMKDANDNEAFTVVNYSAPTDNKTLSITFKAKANGEYTVYGTGGQSTVNITTSGYTLSLAPGEGVFIVSNDTKHTVTFQNWDGTELETTVYNKGETPVYGGAEPTRDGYTFTGWTPAIAPVDGDATYTATFKGLPTITFQNWDGTVLQQSTWNYGTTPSYSGATPTKEGCEFKGWTPEISTVTGDATYTATFNEYFDVTYVSYDGTANTKTDKILYGDSVTYTPTLDGYIFKGWTLNGEAYDVSSEVTEDITLVATWYKTVSGVDEVISAQYVFDNTQVETGYVGRDGAEANPNAGWYFDSDYDGYTGAGETDDNKFANWAKFSLTADGGAGTVEEGRETYIVLPAINYKLYSKVDLAYLNNAKIIGVKFAGTQVAQVEDNHKLISIVTVDGVTTLYFGSLNTVGTSAWPQSTVVLPESVANGTEGLRIDFTVTGYVGFAITEFHATLTASDYVAKINEAVEAIESNSYSDSDIQNYLDNAGYLTEYERANLELSDTVLSVIDGYYANEVLTANAGSDAQLQAIENYRQFNNGLSDELKATDAHRINVALVNKVIYENYYKIEVSEEILLNDPVVDTSNGAVDQDERIQTGWGGHSTDYNTTYSTYVHMIQFTSGNYDGTATLPAINYNAYTEVYFGLRAISAGNGTISIAGGAYSFDNSKNHNWKITVMGGLLIVSDDNKSNNDGGGVLFTAVLSDDVANGYTGLVINFQFDAWSQAEITEMHVLNPFTSSESTFDNVPSGWSTAGTKVANFITAYNATKQKTFDSGTYDGTATLPAFNFNAYDEVYFGIHAIAGATSWSPYVAENGIITINGASFDAINPQNGDYYFKAVVTGGTLTLMLEKANNETARQVFSVALSESVANGTESLVIDFNFGAWSQAEITELHAVTKKVQKIETSVVAGFETGLADGASCGEPNVAIASSSCFSTSSYSTYTYVQDSNNKATSATITLPKLAYGIYAEVRFGVGFAVTVAPGSLTIGGATLEVPSSLIGHWYKMEAVISDGYLILVDAGSSNDVKNKANGYSTDGYFLKVKLSDSVLNGTEALTIALEMGSGYARLEVTEIHTNNWVNIIV